MTSRAASLPRTTVRTVPISAGTGGPDRVEELPELLAVLPDRSPLAWVRNGEGLVGWGVAARVALAGPDRFAAADAWWRAFCAAADVDDPVRVPGSGPVAFGTFTFSPRGAGSTLIVPRMVLGRRAGRAWITTVGAEPAGRPALGPVSLPAVPTGVRYADGAQPSTRWPGTVAEAVRRIRAGEAAKVVLARDLAATCADEVDPRFLLLRLAERFPLCWTFSCDGIVGATPELLVRRQGRAVHSRVLAGSMRRGHDDAEDAVLAAQLLASAKDREEHGYAVRSVVDPLSRSCQDIAAGEPYVLPLANVSHLATDITATAVTGASALELAGRLHPTAAVCGAPRAAAQRLIEELEGFDRRRYAGPVGWVDARGDGEFGIALRCAEVSGRTVRMYAGCGIVADSDPEAELAESQVKLAAMRDALEGV